MTQEVSLSAEEVAGIKQVLENITDCLMTLDTTDLQEMRQLVGDIGAAIKNLATFLDKKGTERNRRFDKGYIDSKLGK